MKQTNLKPEYRSIIRLIITISISLNALIILTIFDNTLFKLRDCVLIPNNEFAQNDQSSKLLDMNDFEYLIAKPKCSVSDPLLFITLVHSGPSNFERRAVLRETWAHSDPRTKTYFVMGAIQSKTLQKQIDHENDKFNDIIQGNFVDTYHNLTYKHSMVLKWFSENCAHVKYLLKVDDDVFVNVPATYEFLSNNRQDTNFLMGVYRTPEKVKRNGKWQMTKNEYTEDYYPEYGYGTSIIYSNDFVVDAYKKTFTTRFLWIDDVFITGLIRMQLNVRCQPIYEYRLDADQVDGIVNGSLALPNSKFMVTCDGLEEHEMIGLWKALEAYRANN